MITKEHKAKKYCCFYASDFHLEMILLPYIRDNLKKSRILIFTQENLLESIKQVLDRTNFSDTEKEEILNLNWNEKQNNLCNIKENDIIIINGEKNYIDDLNKSLLNAKNIIIINCYDINKIKENRLDITREYEGVLNTNFITK